MDDIKTLAEALPAEQHRVRELLKEYYAIGPAGLFGAEISQDALQQADQAVVSGDTVKMLEALKRLQDCQ